jgi:hypothetical protein
MVSRWATRRRALQNSPDGLDRERHQFAATDLLRAFAFRFTPIIEEIPGAALMHDVEQRPSRNQQDHDDGIGLHEGRR